MKILRCVKLAILAGALCVRAAAETPRVDTVTDGEAAQLEEALSRGLTLSQYDQAAWHATDQMLADISDPAGAGIRGWVVTRVNEGWNVTFFKPSGAGVEGVYSAIYDGKSVISHHELKGSATRLTDEQTELAHALSLPDTSGLARCSDKPFNPVVMPSNNGTGSIFVYYLTPQTSMSSVPIGGHYRFEVLNNRVVSKRRFTNACLELSITDASHSGKPEALVVTHLLDPVPTELHVFSVFAAGVPLDVVTSTNKAIWVLEVSQGQPRARLIGHAD